jgi:hypothetical protein
VKRGDATGRSARLLFTGDLGQRGDQPIDLRHDYD